MSIPAPDEISIEDPLCNSSLGSMVTLDYVTPLTASVNWFPDLPEWLKNFTENIEDEGVLASRDTPANTSQDSDSERPAKVVSRVHSIFTHFPKDKNFEVCKRTRITMALCRRRIGGAVPRAEKFGDLITADHNVLN